MKQACSCLNLNNFHVTLSTCTQIIRASHYQDNKALILGLGFVLVSVLGVDLIKAYEMSVWDLSWFAYDKLKSESLVDFLKAVFNTIWIIFLYALGDQEQQLL